MPTVLITGASRGLGAEFVRQYLKQGWTVIAACRDPANATDLKALQARVGAGPLSGEPVPPSAAQGPMLDIISLDVGDPDSIQALCHTVGCRPLDLLINNAGIKGLKTHQSFGSIDHTAFLDTLQINALGPVLVSQVLMPNLRAAVREQGQAKIAMISSRMGSIGENSDGGNYLYRSSKAALNAIAKGMALDLAPLGIHLAVLHPGWVRTDMGGAAGLIDPPESVAGMCRVLGHLTAQQSGRFMDYQGKDVGW